MPKVKLPKSDDEWMRSVRVPISKEIAAKCRVGESCEVVLKGKINEVRSEQRAPDEGDGSKIRDMSEMSIVVDTVDFVYDDDEEGEYGELAEA